MVQGGVRFVFGGTGLVHGGVGFVLRGTGLVQRGAGLVLGGTGFVQGGEAGGNSGGGSTGCDGGGTGGWEGGGKLGWYGGGGKVRGFAGGCGRPGWMVLVWAGADIRLTATVTASSKEGFIFMIGGWLSDPEKIFSKARTARFLQVWPQKTRVIARRDETGLALCKQPGHRRRPFASIPGERKRLPVAEGGPLAVFPPLTHCF